MKILIDTVSIASPSNAFHLYITLFDTVYRHVFILRKNFSVYKL